MRLREAALRTGAVVVYRPVSGAWIDGYLGGSLASLVAHLHPSVASYINKDLGDWARFCGVEIQTSWQPQVSTEWAQRGAIVAIECGRIAVYADAVFRAVFSDGRDISQREVVLELAVACGLSGADFERRLDSEEVLAAVRANGAELLARGGFGSPTMFVAADMYFGHDRLPLVESALMRSSEQPFIAPGEHGR